MHGPYSCSQPGQMKIIHVNGKAKIAVKPDTVIVRLEVHTENKSLAQAQQENAQTMRGVIGSLLKLGIRQEDMQTTTFTIQPMYDYVDEKQVFRGFAVSNELSVSFEEVDAAGVIIDTAVENGVNRVSDIRFSVENQAYFYKQALIMALEDAVSKALAISEKMQLNLDPYPVRVDEITGESHNPGQTFSTTLKNMAPIEPGRITITAGINVQFQY